MRVKAIWPLLICLIAAVLVLSYGQSVLGKKAVPEGKKPQYGGTLTVIDYLSGRPPQSWDPANFAWTTFRWSNYYQEYLLTGDLEKGPRGSNEFDFNILTGIPWEFVKNSLAVSWEIPTPTKIILHLRKGIYWQEKPGVMKRREMTADDVVFCFNRQLESPKLLRKRYERLKGIEKIDKYTFALNFNEFEASWGWYLAFGYYWPIYPKEMVDAGPTDWRNVCGTGPFMLTEYATGSSLTYERNPDYWGKTTLGGKEYQLPFIDRLKFPLIKDESTRVAAIRSKKADICQNVPWEYEKSLEQRNPDLVKFVFPSSSASLVCMRTDTPPFDKIKVRRAMCMAVDNQAILKSQYGGVGEMHNCPYQPGLAAYTPLKELPQSARELFEYHPEKAKKLLAEAGYSNGFSTEILLQDVAATIDLVSACVDYWGKIGVNVKLKTSDYSTLWGTWVAKKHPAMTYMGRGQPTPLANLQALAQPGDIQNLAMYDDLYINETLIKIRGMTDASARSALLKELGVYFIDQAGYLILPVGAIRHYAWPWVKNWYGETNVGAQRWGPIAAEIWLDPELKKK